MRTYELISHIADIRLRAEGDSLQELFIAALEGMNFIAEKGKQKIPINTKEKIVLSSMDRTTLLIDFLSEVLTSMHINRAIYTNVAFDELTDKSLSATILGHTIESFDEDIKAVTYHEAEVIKNEEGNFEVIIVFDI